MNEGFDAVLRTGEATDSRLMSRVIGGYRQVIVASPDYLQRKGITGRERFDYSTNNHKFAIGTGEHQFTLQFSKGSGVSIGMYNDPADIDCIAIASNAGRFEDVHDACVFNYTSRDIAVDEGRSSRLKTSTATTLWFIFTMFVTTVDRVIIATRSLFLM